MTCLFIRSQLNWARLEQNKGLNTRSLWRHSTFISCASGGYYSCVGGYWGGLLQRITVYYAWSMSSSHWRSWQACSMVNRAQNRHSTRSNHSKQQINTCIAKTTIPILALWRCIITSVASSKLTLLMPVTVVVGWTIVTHGPVYTNLADPNTL